ncbi:MAG TPA: four helix bundle protein [Gemmatimonadales bacterium]|jgi:four helix bundle protein|nr:four helix bundle protein [Gemmatimonadales bacterium]
MAPYKRLLAWQECHRLVLDVYKATQSFPKHELYGLTSQVRRAAFSAAANIVEGSSRRGRRELRRFLDIAVASLSEVEYALEVANALEYVRPDVYAELEAQQRRARFLAWKLHASLREPGQ